MFDYFNGNEWTKLDYERFNGVHDIENVESIYKCGEYIKAVYTNGKEIWYKNYFGCYRGTILE